MIRKVTRKQNCEWQTFHKDIGLFCIGHKIIGNRDRSDWIVLRCFCMDMRLMWRFMLTRSFLSTGSYCACCKKNKSTTMIRTKFKFMGRQLVEIIFPCLYDGLLYFDWNSPLWFGWYSYSWRGNWSKKINLGCIIWFSYWFLLTVFDNPWTWCWPTQLPRVLTPLLLAMVCS